jgi:hypothetical protein
MLALDAYSRQLVDFIADANPNLQESAMEEALLQRKTMIINSFKAYAAKDYIAAYQHARNAYKIMFMTADGITAAISAQFPNKYPKANAMTKSSELRSMHERIWGERALLEVMILQKGYSASADLDAASSALDNNTHEMAGIIGSIYGQAASENYKALGNLHIGLLKDYTKAAAAKDETKRQAASKNLEVNGLAQAKFLAGVNPKYTESNLSASINNNSHLLQKAFDNYAAGQYTSAYTDLRTAYAQMVIGGMNYPLEQQLNTRINSAV